MGVARDGRRLCPSESMGCEEISLRGEVGKDGGREGLVPVAVSQRLELVG